MDESNKNVNIKIDTVPYLPNIYLGNNNRKDFIDFSNAISADKTIFIFNMVDNVIKETKYNDPNFFLFGNDNLVEFNLPPINYFYNNVSQNNLAKNNYKILSFRYESSDFDNILLNEIGYKININTISLPKNINNTLFSTTTESVIINPKIDTKITLTIETGKAFTTNELIVISSTTDSSNYFQGTIFSYDVNFGIIEINVDTSEVYGNYTNASYYNVSILGNEFFRELEITDFKSNKFIVYFYYFKYLYLDSKNPNNLVNYNNFTNNIFYNKQNWNIFIYPFNDVIDGYTYIKKSINIEKYPTKNSIYNYINVIDFSELKLTNIKDNIDYTYFEKKNVNIKNLNKTFYLSKNIKSFNDYINKNKDDENIFISLNEINYFYNETLEDNLSYLNSDTNTIIADFLKKNKTFVNTTTGTSLSMDNKICYLNTKDKYFNNTTYAQYISNVDLTEKLYDFDLIYCVNSYFDIISYKEYIDNEDIYNELNYVNQNLRKILLLINPNLIYDDYVNSQYEINGVKYNTVNTNIINLIDNPINYIIDDTNKLKIRAEDTTKITELKTKSYIICRYLFILSYVNYAGTENQKIQYYYIYINIAFYNSNYVNIINQFKTSTFDVCYVCKDYLNANITISPTIFNLLKKTNMYQNILKWNFVDTKIYSFIYNYDLYSEYKDRTNSIIINNFYFLLVNIIQNITYNDGENDYIINNFNDILFEKINNFISNIIILNNTNSTLGYNKYLSRTDNLFNIITDTNIDYKYYTEFKYLPVENSRPDNFEYPVNNNSTQINYLPFGIYRVFKFNNYNPSSYTQDNFIYTAILSLTEIVKYNYQLLIRVSPPYEYDDKYYDYINLKTETTSAVVINPNISPIILTVGSNLTYVTGNIIYVSDTTEPTINNFIGEVYDYDSNNGILIINNITNINGNFNNEVIYNVNLYNDYNDFINNNNSLFTNRCEMYLIITDINGDIIYVENNRILCFKLFNFYTGEQNIFNRLQLYINTVLYNNFYGMNIIYEDYYPYYVDSNSSNINNVNTMALNYNGLKFNPHINDYVKDILIYDLERFNNNIYNISELYYNVDLMIDITKNNDNLYKIQQIIDNCVYLMYLLKVIILLKRVKCYFIILNNIGIYYKFPVSVPIISNLTINDFYKIILNDIHELKDACNYIYNLNFFSISISKLESFVSFFKNITELTNIYLEPIKKLFYDNINIKYLDVNNISLTIIYIENLIIDFTNNKNDTIINITELTTNLNILNYTLQIETFLKKYNDTFRILNYFENSINELKPETKELFLFKNQTLLYLYNINSYYDILNFNKIFDNESFNTTINSLNLIKKDYIFSTTLLEQKLKYSYFCISKFISKFNDDPNTSLIDFDLEILKTVEKELKDNINNYQNNIKLTSITINLVLIDTSLPEITLFIQPNKAFIPGNQVTVSSIINSSNYFNGTVVIYDSITGEIVITPSEYFGVFTDITKYYITVPLTINNENLNLLLDEINKLISNYPKLAKIPIQQFYLEFYYINDIVYYLNKYVYLIKELLLIDAYKKQILSFPTIDNPDPYDVLAMNLNENIISLKNIIINIDSVYKDKNQEIIHIILNDNTFNNINFYSQINVFSYNDHLQYSSNNFIINVWNPETYSETITYNYTLTSNNYVFGYIINSEIYTLIETLYQSKISFFDVYMDNIEDNILIKNSINYGFVNTPLSYKS